MIKLAKFANLGADLIADLEDFTGNYSKNSPSPRNLPSDEDIAALRENFKNQSWRWVYGILATYGLETPRGFLPGHGEPTGSSENIAITGCKTLPGHQSAIAIFGKVRRQQKPI